MKLYEFEAKTILKKYSIPIPAGLVISDEISGLSFFQKNKPVILKAQILAGGRGKAGGIKPAYDEREYKENFNLLLNSKIKNLPVRKLLIEQMLDIEKEIYISYSILRTEAKIALILSASGGVEIESNLAVSSYPIDINEGISIDNLAQLVGNLGLNDGLTEKITTIANSLYSIFTEYECEIAEINPLAILTSGEIIAADAKIAIFDEAADKYSEFKKEDDNYTELERFSQKQGLGYVEMNGNIGVIGNGAGLNMATLDILTYFGGKPANFLEVSGRTYHKAFEAMKIIMSNSNVKMIFGNFFGCISRCDIIAKGLAEAFSKGIITVPIVIAMRGTGASDGIKTLKAAGFTDIFQDDIDAGKRIAEILQKL